MARQRKQAGYTTRAGNVWDADGVRRVLRNEALLGTFTWAFPGATILGEVFKAQTFTYTCEPVLDATTLAEVTRLLALSNRGKYRSGRTRYPLSGHIYGACGRRMHGAEYLDRLGRRYRCDAQDKEPCSCRKRTVVADKVETAVATWITLNLIRPEVVEQLLREHRARQEDALVAERQAARPRKREAALMGKQEDVFLRFDGEAADRVLSRVEEELATVRSQLATMQEAIAAVDFTADDLAQAIEAVVGSGTKRSDLRSDDDLSRLVRMLDVRVGLVERADGGRSIQVTGRIRVPEMNASYGA